MVVKIGRSVGYRKSLETKAEEYKDVIRYLKKGLSLKETAKLTGRADGTVLTIKKDFNIIKPIISRTF